MSESEPNGSVEDGYKRFMRTIVRAGVSNDSEGTAEAGGVDQMSSGELGMADRLPTGIDPGALQIIKSLRRALHTALVARDRDRILLRRFGEEQAARANREAPQPSITEAAPDEPKLEADADMIDAVDTSNFATKAELAELRGDMKVGFAEIRADIAGMRKDFAEERTTTVKWMVTLVAAGVGLLGVWITISTKQAPAPAATAQQPITINVPGTAPVPATPASR